MTGVGDSPHEEGKTVQPERQDAPDEEEAEHEREADDVRDKARETAGVDATIKSVDAKIEFGAGVELESLAPFPLLDLCGNIVAASPKFIESCDLCPAAPMLSHSAPNILWVEIGRTVGATGKTLGTVPAGAKLWKPPAQAQGSDGGDVAASLIQGNGDCNAGAAAAAAWAGGHSPRHC